jgi:hypothetical protein
MKLSSWATMQPNWLGDFATYAAVQALNGNGKDIAAFAKIPLPITGDADLGQVSYQGQGLYGRRPYVLALRPKPFDEFLNQN